ncbi:MAG: ferritin family protein [Acidobacteriota bacterium]
MTDDHEPFAGRPDDSVGSFLLRAIDAEKVAKEVYDLLAEMFAHEPDVSGFWKDLARDEAAHHEALEMILVRLTAEQLAQTIGSDRAARWRALRLQPAGQLVRSVQTLQHAYELAHELEHSEVNAMFAFFTSRFVTPVERGSFYRAQIELHLQKLEQFSDTHGDMEWRRSVLARRA